MKTKTILIPDKTDIKIRDADPELHKQFVSFANKKGKTAGELYNQIISTFLSTQKGKKNPSGYSADKRIFSIMFRQANLEGKVKLILDWCLAHRKGTNKDIDTLVNNTFRYVVSEEEYLTEYNATVKRNKEIGKENPENSARNFMENVFIKLSDNNFNEEFERRYAMNHDYVVWVREIESIGYPLIRDLIVGRVEDFSASTIIRVIEQYKKSVRSKKDYNGIMEDILTKLEQRKQFFESLALKVGNELFGSLY